MAAKYEDVDFLIVTALKEETQAITELLEEKRPLAHDLLGKVSREGSADKYVVALTGIGGMGTNAAQAEAREALGRLNPNRVILTGIAAGFPEAGVDPGDILVPYAIVDYELAKLKEPSAGRLKKLLKFFRGKVKFEHRGLAICLSYGLWHAANTLGRDETSAWVDAIRVPRPDGIDHKPAVHSEGNSVLGSGEKVVATKFAETRKWLLKEFPRQAIGLEMESLGVQRACHVTDTPFLVVKASQDPGTKEKDTPDDKDIWRAYAAQAAAAFSIALIRRFELEYDALVIEHMNKVREIAQHFEQSAPKPAFTYKVSRAESYTQFKERIYFLRSQVPNVLIPNDGTPTIALHGGAGTGKTRIIKSLMGPLIDAGLCPVFVDLKEYSVEGKHGQDAEDPETLVQDILLAGSVPRRTPRELERLAGERGLVALIDGLNEVSNEARTMIIEYFSGLHRKGTCYLLVTDRFGPAVSLETFSHAAVDRLDPRTVEKIFDNNFGAGSFQKLSKRLRRIYRRPFFLSLALTSKRKFTRNSIWTGIFEEFFRNHLRMTGQELNLVAQSTLHAFNNDASFDLSRFKEMVNGAIYDLLVDAEVLGREDSGFEHHLWRDYFVSRYLAQNADDWKDPIFDVVTTFASSLECLSLTVEQLRDRAIKDTFLKLLFDWNYFAAAGCISDFQEDDPQPRQLSPSIRSAILAAIAEKRFDAIQRTRKRADELIRDHRYDFAIPFSKAETREALAQHVKNLNGTENWFKCWRALFTKASGEKVIKQEIDLIASDDSLIGWTAANLARRSIVNEKGMQRFRDIYGQACKSEESKSIRWRVVHILGAFPSSDNVELLLKALQGDPYHWVQYGAARALVEIASQSDKDIREQVLGSLGEFIRTYDQPKLWIRRQIFREIIEAVFIRSPKPGWKEAVLLILTTVVQREVEQSYQDLLNERLSAFKSYD